MNTTKSQIYQVGISQNSSGQRNETEKTALLSFIQGNKDLFSIIIIIIIINSTIHHSQEWFVWDKQASKVVSNNEQNTKIPSIRPVSNACAKIKTILFGLIKKNCYYLCFIW